MVAVPAALVGATPGVSAAAVPGILAVFAGTGTAGVPTPGGAATNSNLDSPEGVAVDGAGNVYIADTFNNQIEKVTPAGSLSVIAGTGTAGSPIAGPATNSDFGFPTGVAVDGAGNVYIADRGNNEIEKVTPQRWRSRSPGRKLLGERRRSPRPPPRQPGSPSPGRRHAIS
jgi:sugar lactone lactonase YvrE